MSKPDLLALLRAALEDPGLPPAGAQALARAAAAECLRRVPRDQPLGSELFGELAWHSYTIACEGALLRRREGRLEIFLARRRDDDPVANWRGQLHVPGVVILPGEVGSAAELERPLGRLSQREYGGLVTKSRAIGEAWTIGSRGPVLTKIFLVECARDPAALALGEWHDVAALPPDVLSYHRQEVIPLAVSKW